MINIRLRWIIVRKRPKNHSNNIINQMIYKYRLDIYGEYADR